MKGEDMKIELSYTNDDGEQELYEFPAKYEVCSDCEGHGSVLCEGMRGHAYSMEDFDREFSYDEQEEYFKVGGAYDVPCPTCKGSRVEKVIDLERLTKSQARIYNMIEEQAEEFAKELRDDAMTRRGECGIYQ